MKWIISFSFLFLFFGQARAYHPIFIPTQSQFDVIEITEPELSKVFYGKLDGIPHTYQITSSKPFSLYVEVLLPDIDGVDRQMSAIVVRQAERGVDEVARVTGADTTWDISKKFFGGDRYLSGESFNKKVDAGTYIIQVHSLKNIGKYVLLVGSEENIDNTGYFESIGMLIEVKKFFNKS